MPSINDLNTIKQFLNALSWKKMAQLSVFIIIIASAWMLFLSRDSAVDIITYIITPADKNAIIKPKLSASTMDLIDATVNKSDLIVGIVIVSVNLQKNIQHVVYPVFDEASLASTATKMLELPNVSPLFSSVPDNNALITNVINGNFICSKYDLTTNAQLYPDTPKFINTVCINGIPPHYGTFSGMVMIFTKRAPTIEEIDQIRLVSRKISSIVHDTDSSAK